MKKLKDFINLVETSNSRKSNEPMFKAIFVTGGPGSGKDIVVRKAINEFNIIELSNIQIKEYLGDKQKLSQKSGDVRLESLRQRKSLIINSPADDFDRIAHIKEELEDLGYDTMMIFVSTSDEVSKERNSYLSRSMNESVRHNKWSKSQSNMEELAKIFEKFLPFDNSEDIAAKRRDILEINHQTKLFLNAKSINEIATDWLDNNNSDINEKINSLFKENGNVKKITKLFQEANSSGKSRSACGTNHGSIGSRKVITDNNSPAAQMQRKAGKIDDVRDGDVKSNSDYIFRAYEETGSSTKKVTATKESNFEQDKDKTKKIKRGDTSLSASRVGRPDGIGSTYDSRGTAGLVGGVGLGQEEVSTKGVKFKKLVKPSENFKNMNTASTNGGGQEFSTAQSGTGQADGARMGNSFVNEKKDFRSFRKAASTKEGLEGGGEVAMGVGGVLGGAGNKENMDTYYDVNRNIKNDYINKKKNNKGVK